MNDDRRLLLLSNGTALGGTLFEHAWAALSDVLGDATRLVFIPFARADHEEYTQLISVALAPLGVDVIGAHTTGDPPALIDSADAVFVGGGNSFRLLASMQRHGLIGSIRARVLRGMPYIGSSAGSNMACPTLRTTNDMPIVQPLSFEALNLVPFQINPHYPVAPLPAAIPGESRDMRIAEFLEENDVPVLGLCEGSWLTVRGSSAQLGGVAPGRLFRRGTEPEDLQVGADLSHLLTTVPVFDSAQ